MRGERAGVVGQVGSRCSPPSGKRRNEDAKAGPAASSASVLVEGLLRRALHRASFLRR
jgi:hypothetical protein